MGGGWVGLGSGVAVGFGSDVVGFLVGLIVCVGSIISCVGSRVFVVDGVRVNVADEPGAGVLLGIAVWLGI